MLYDRFMQFKFHFLLETRGRKKKKKKRKKQRHLEEILKSLHTCCQMVYCIVLYSIKCDLKPYTFDIPIKANFLLIAFRAFIFRFSSFDCNSFFCYF